MSGDQSALEAKLVAVTAERDEARQARNDMFPWANALERSIADLREQLAAAETATVERIAAWCEDQDRHGQYLARDIRAGAWKAGRE